VTAWTPVYAERIPDKQILLRPLARKYGRPELDPVLDPAGSFEAECEEYSETERLADASYRGARRRGG
jgi:hypothetical protein